jgi:uncharacterized protein with HEPN domain
MNIKTEDKIRLLDMADSIREIQGYLGETDYEEFSISDDIRESVTAQMVYIGEAAELLSDEFKEQYGNIDWNVLTNLKFARYDEEYEQEHRQMMYIASQDLPEIMNDILDVATMVEDEDDLDEVSLNEEDKQDIASLQEDRKINNTRPKAEVVFTDEDRNTVQDLQEEEPTDDSYIDQRFEDEDIVETSSLGNYPEDEDEDEEVTL